MQDKDMDNLFRSKLEDLEIKPSAEVWSGISSELSGTPDRRTGYMPFLKVAASIAILITAGLLFLPKNKVKVDQPKLVRNHPVKTPAVVQQTQSVEQVNINTGQQQATIVQSKQQLTAVRYSTVKHPGTTIVKKQPVINPDKADGIVNTQSATVIAKAEPKVPVNQPVVPDAALSVKSVDETPEFIIKPAVVLASNATDENAEKPTPAKKHKIHGLGGLINMVVASVDKRKDKIIEFTDTDEGDTVTGINLGFVKVKKEK